MNYQQHHNHYFFDWTKLWDFYLTDTKVKFITSDSDIICVRLDIVNHESEFKALLEGYDRWIEDNKHDMSIFPDAKGSMYHRS